MAKIKVLIADDHAVLRSGLQLLINGQPDMQVVDQAADFPEALRKAQQWEPDVVLLDLSMPGGSAVATIERLRQQGKARVLVLTMHDDVAYMRAALAAGALGYVVKTAADTELMAAIRAVHQHRLFVDMDLSDCLVQSVFDRKAGSPAPRSETAQNGLSRREGEVLLLLAQGYTNQQAADKLYLSVKTVETYRARIAEKLDLHNRADLFRYATVRGLLKQDP